MNRAEVLTAQPRMLVAAEQFESLLRFLTRALADPKMHPLPAHVAALTDLGSWLKKYLKRPREPVSRWLAACCAQLEARAATGPTAPADFCREASARCDCADCKELKAFLKALAEQVHRFRTRQDRRQHLEQQIERHGCDTDCTGSPQTPVCTKATASFGARLKKYRDDWMHLATLPSLTPSEPTNVSLRRTRAATRSHFATCEMQCESWRAD